MKKFYSFLFAAVALVGFAACNSDSTEEPAPAQENVGKMEFTANIGEDTKTQLGETTDGMTEVLWCDDDVIGVNDKSYTIKEGTNEGTTATLVGDPVEAPYVAVYPLSAFNSYNKEQEFINITLDANVAAGTFADGANIALAFSNDTNLSFKNLLSVLKFQVAAECETVTIKSENPLVGTVNFNYECFYAGATTYETSIELTIDGGFKTGTTYYTTIIPGIHKFTVLTDGKPSRQAKSGTTLYRNQVVDLGTLPAPVSSDNGVVGSFQGWDIANPVAMYIVDGWAVATGVEFYKGDEFKIVTGTSWDNPNYGFQDVTVAEVDTEYTLDGTANLKVGKNGLFDIYFKVESKTFKYTCVEEYTGTVDITIDNKANWNPLYITLKQGETVIAENATVTDNKFAVGMEYIGEDLSYTLSNGTKMMEGNVAITKNGATINLEETVIKLKVQLDTDNAKQWWGNTMKIHVWNASTSFNTSWPGTTMTSEGNYTWSIQVPSELVGKTIDYLVHNGNGWQSDDAKVTISAEGNTVTGSSINIK